MVSFASPFQGPFEAPVQGSFDNSCASVLVASTPGPAMAVIDAPAGERSATFAPRHVASYRNRNRPFARDLAPEAERRRSPRVPLSGTAMASFKTAQGDSILTRIEYVDAALGGWGVRSSVAVEPGATFALYSGTVGCPVRKGRVVRCELGEEGFHLGLRIEAGQAAA
ncbi:MAG: PilZ domain-containing protein [Planctomycetota bacterium]|nr:PilZ domain-containing protein [Planctomycetota bacterium]